MATETVPARILPAPSRSSYWFDIVFGRTVPAVFFGIFLIAKGWNLHDAVAILIERGRPADYLASFSQLLSLAYFGVLVGLYVTRLPKRAGDARPAMIVVSFFGSFSILFVALLPGVHARPYLLLPSALLVAAGLAYTLWSLAYLQRSFSILPEARRLVTGGPYGLSRHPLYLGEGVATIGVVLPTVGPAGAALITLFLASQYVRIRAEERVLRQQFPEYAAYAQRVPRYLPDPRRLLRPS